MEKWEKLAIVGFHLKNLLEGYRWLIFMMLDAVIVAVSPSSVWRVLGQAGLLSKWNGKPSKRAKALHYLNIGGPFYHLCSILNGFSRHIMNWDIRESMAEAGIGIILTGSQGEARRRRDPGSSRTTGRGSSRKTSRSSFGSRA
ncbi:MAG: hypothetical protein FJW40_21575 [Acidobacteria bacterium]|nr:hypothetical protein [Acidobacteriota bacterium]